MTGGLRDLRIAVRSLVKSPAVTFAAVAALALGIGANTALFSVLDGVLLEPLPYPHPERLVQLIDNNLAQDLPRFSSSPPNFADWRQMSRSFEDLAASTRTSLNLAATGAEPERLVGAQVSAGYFEVMGIRPLSGRTFVAADDRPGAGKVTVLGHGLWQRRFAGDLAVVGRSVVLNGEPYEVVGIMPEGFVTPRKVEAWVPLAIAIDENGRGDHWLTVTGRLKPEVSLEQASAEMKTIASRLEKEHPDSNTGWSVAVRRVQELMVEDVRPALLVLMATVALVLLIACANVAHLLLARFASREREVAIRGALGADRRSLVRLFLGETLLLSAAGGGLGLLLALAGTRALVQLSAGSIPRAEAIGIDARVLAFAAALSLATGLLLGLLPALHGTRKDLRSPLSEGGRAVGGGGAARRVRSVLVFAEVTLAVLLLIGAGLLLRSFAGLRQVSPGFSAADVLTVRLSLPESVYRDEAQQRGFVRDLLPRLAAQPGVQQAAVSFPLPLDGTGWVSTYSVEGRPPQPPGQGLTASMRFITQGFLQALEVPLVAGRNFGGQDDENGTPAVLVNQALADKIWPGGQALGKRLSFGDGRDADPQWMTVVGVVGNIRARSLDVEPGMEIYRPILQQPMTELTLVLRGSPGHVPDLGPIREAVRSLDAGLPLFSSLPMSEVVSSTLAGERFNTVLLGVFAALALALASLGVYGVISYTVSLRNVEMGLRMALGARPGEVVGLVMRQGLLPVVAGVAAGLAAAPLAGRALAGLLYRVDVVDPLTYVLVPAVLVATALVASLLPARRATRVDPMVALRAD